MLSRVVTAADRQAKVGCASATFSHPPPRKTPGNAACERKQYLLHGRNYFNLVLLGLFSGAVDNTMSDHDSMALFCMAVARFHAWSKSSSACCRRVSPYASS